jgi:hypothetical protein
VLGDVPICTRQVQERIPAGRQFAPGSDAFKQDKGDRPRRMPKHKLDGRNRHQTRGHESSSVDSGSVEHRRHIICQQRRRELSRRIARQPEPSQVISNERCLLPPGR